MEKKLDYIDALRGIAILGVVLVHAKNHFGLTGLFSNIAALGAKGVQLFYFISAFTLFLSYNNRKYEEQFPISNFFIRRFFRIAPLYYFAIFYYSIQLLLVDDVKTPFKELFLNFTFTHGFSPLYINHLVPGGWSIAVEMSFYVMVPLLMSKINNTQRALIFIFISLIFRFLLVQYFALNPIDSNPKINSDYLYWYLPNQLPCFAIGILFYFISKDIKKLEIKARFTNFKIVIISSILSFLCVVDQMFIRLNFFNWDFLFCIVFFVFAIVLSNNKTLLIVNKFTTASGKYSYSMYIIHFIVLFWIDKMGINIDKTIFNFIFYYLIVVSVTMLLSIVTYKLIEIPTQLLGKKIINKRETANLSKAI